MEELGEEDMFLSEEEEEEEEEEESEVIFLQKPSAKNKNQYHDNFTAFPVECNYSVEELLERIKHGIEPEDGHELIARGRIQSEKIPFIVVSKDYVEHNNHEDDGSNNNGNGIISKLKVVNSTSLLNSTCSKEWRNYVRIQFLETKKRVELVKTTIETIEKQEKIKVLRPIADFPISKERIQWVEYISKNPPLLHILIHLDTLAIVRILKHLVRTIGDDFVYDYVRLGWVYACFVCMEEPFTFDIDAILRDLYRIMGNALVEGNNNEQIEKDAAVLTLCLLQDIFKQHDEEIN